MERDGARYRVVTLENGQPQGNVSQGSKPLVTPRLIPLDLIGINDFRGELSNRTRFCWRWLTRRNGESYRCITLEEGSDEQLSGFGSIRPRDFRGVNDYGKELSDAFFCWRWYSNDREVKYRVLTLEENGFCPHLGSSSITPGFLIGVNGYSEEAAQFSLSFPLCYLVFLLVTLFFQLRSRYSEISLSLPVPKRSA